MVNSTRSLLFVKILLALTILFNTVNSKAAGICLADKSDIALDMKIIAEKLNIKYGDKNLTVKDYINQIYDEQQLKVDRSDPFLKQVNAVGVITDAPLGTQEGYATAVLISPCHVLVNAHGVMNKDAKQGKAPVYISLGQNTCDSKNEFAHQDMPGKVIAIGDQTQDPDSISDSKDYAIVRIQQISDIETPVVSTDFISINDSLATVGFPYSSTYSQKTGLRYPTLNFTRKTSVELDGTFKVLNKEKTPGASGAGMFILDKDEKGDAQMVLGGILVGHRKDGTGGTGLQTAAIIQHLKATNIKAYNEVKVAIQNNSCN